jgi:hypothetical protein
VKRQIVYVSTAADVSDVDLDAILRVAERNNSAEGLTGFLLYNGRNFLQYIEGEEAVLRPRLERIKTDPRHGGLVVLHDEPAEMRCFPDWTMRHVALLPDYKARRERVSEEIGAERLGGVVQQLVESFAMLN